MKRIAVGNLTEDMYIEYGHSNRVYDFAPRVCDRNGNIIGYITCDSFHRMTKEGKLVKILGDYWYARYALASK